MAQQQHAFPEIEGPEFVRSSEVEAVAEKVLELHGGVGGVPRLHPIAEAVRDGDLAIMWLLNEKPFNEDTEDDQEPEIAGRCVKAPRLWHDVTGVHFAIWARKHFWDLYGIELRRALVLHELLHIDLGRDKNGEMKLSTRKHDVEDFVDIARQYGPSALAGEGGSYVRAAALFADPPKSIRPTRSLVDEVMDRAVDEVNAGALGPNVTASRVERRVTVAPEPCPFHGCILAAEHGGDHVYDEAPG